MQRSSYLFKFYQNILGVVRARDGHRDVNFRYVVAPPVTMPTKLVPLSSTPEETTALLAHGEREAEH